MERLRTEAIRVRYRTAQSYHSRDGTLFLCKSVGRERGAPCQRVVGTRASTGGSGVGRGETAAHLWTSHWRRRLLGRVMKLQYSTPPYLYSGRSTIVKGTGLYGRVQA